MFPRYLLICQLTLLWLLLSAATQASPRLSGIATHSELGQEQFLAALYSETLSKDARAMFNTAEAKRMELKILAPEGIAPRRFTRMWIEGAAINIPATTMNSQAKNMLAFDQIFRGRLELNDHLVFDFIPQQGTVISLNTVRLGTIENPDFFDVLLRTWIGNVPLSSAYRDALLMEGDIDVALLQRFIHMEPRLSRIAVAQSWLDVELPVADTPPASNQAIAVIANVSSSAKSSLGNRINTQTASSAREKTTLLAATPQAPPSLQTELARTNHEPAAAPPKINPATSAGTTKNDDDNLSQLTAQSLVAQQFYISDAMRRIYTKLIYPRRARELQQSGTVKIRIAIDAAGNITALQPLEMSDHRLLNQAVESAIKNSVPFPPLPAEITAQQLEFAVPITFSLGQSQAAK